MEEKYVINIGRQLGSGGREIGKKLAEQLGISYYDKELIQEAAKESGLCEEVFEGADEKNKSFLSGNFFGIRFPFMSDDSITKNMLSNDSIFQIQSDVIRNLADDHSCLFVGRCADYILRENPRCVNVFISSGTEDRIKRIADLYKLTETKAKELIEKTDKKRAEYYNYYTVKTWGAAASYHLCIDSSVLGMDETTTLIKNFAERKLGKNS